MADPGKLPPSNIETDQSRYPFWALEKWIRELIAFLIGSVFGPGASTVVWRPGGVTAGNVFATWAEVVAQVATMNGAITIGLDTDLAAAVIPPGNYDLRPVGISGPVTFVNASKAPAFAAPFFTIGPGAVTIKGLTGLDDVQIDNQSTVAVMTITANGSFSLHGRAIVFQTGAGPFWAITGGDYAILLSDASQISVTGGPAVALTVAAPATLLLTLEDNSSVATGMVTDAAGTMTVAVAGGAQYFAQAGAPTIVPTIQRQSGSTAIAIGTGKTAAIPAFISATSKILVSQKTPAGDALTVKYAALAADRVVGAPGSFQITAILAAGGGAVNGADTSTIDWEVIAGP